MTDSMALVQVELFWVVTPYVVVVVVVVASIFALKVEAARYSETLVSYRNILHSVTTQKTMTSIFTAVITSDLARL
jgi:ABC-type spermidine/putrescine transport system permease subunit I